MKFPLILCLFIYIGHAIGQVIIPLDTIKVKKDSRITSDNLGNVYLISPTNDIEKYNVNGIKVATANFKVLGNITSVDASNPFEIYVFYRDQNKVLYLDNMLNLRGETNLETIDVSQCAAVARSFDNNLWLVDMGDQKIKKYSKDSKFIGESASLNTVITDEPIIPESMLDLNSTLYILNNGAILNFDAFINYTKTVISDSISSFQIVNNRIVYLKNGAIHVYDPYNFRFDKLNFNFTGKIKNMRIEKERLYILTDENLILHSYSEK